MQFALKYKPLFCVLCIIIVQDRDRDVFVFPTRHSLGKRFNIRFFCGSITDLYVAGIIHNITSTDTKELMEMMSVNVR